MAVVKAELTVKRRPLLRGWSHAAATVGAIAFTIALAARCAGNPVRLSTMLLYGLSLVGLFGFSAVYHIVTWKPDVRELLGHIDYGNIFIKIAATATAIGATVLDGWERTALLVSVWGLALLGVGLNLLPVPLPRGPRVALYILTGLAGAIATPGLVAALPTTAIVAMIAGGALYVAGGVVYAMKAPDPCPRVFGYHEVFHLLVIAGAVAFGSVVWIWVVPFAT